MYSIRPVHAVGDDGRMALTDHLRELRGRLLRGVTALVVAVLVMLFFTDQLQELVTSPYRQAMETLGKSKSYIDSKIILSGIGAALMMQLKLAGIAGVLVSCPFWLYQIWAFILPGLHRHEKRWTMIFVAIAGPLFVAGAAVGYYVLPKGLETLIGITPEGFDSLVDFNDFFSFVIRMLLIFGVAFEIPLFVVLLNLVGVVSGRKLAEHRPWAILAIFVFAAVGTPSTDPISMLFLAVPMTILWLISEVLSRLLDRRRRSAIPVLDPDQASPLP